MWVFINKRMHQCLCYAVTEIAYLRLKNPKIALWHETHIMGDLTTMILSQSLTKEQPEDLLIVFTEVVFFGWKRQVMLIWEVLCALCEGLELPGGGGGRSLQCHRLLTLSVSHHYFLKSLNHRTVLMPGRRVEGKVGTAGGEEGGRVVTEGASWGGCQLTDCQEWWCEKRTMSQSVFCYVSVQWREKTGEARELMKWLHSGGEGKGGGLCRTAGRKHHCLTHFYNAQ